MLSNRASLMVAEQFGMLEGLHPGRIDLDVGFGPAWQSVLPQPVLSLALRLALGPPATVQLFPHG